MDELISREAVKEMMKNHRVDFSTEKDYRMARACANAVPPVEPKRIHATWISKVALQDGQITLMDYKCSNCSHHREKPMNYCEVCGAKMEMEG